MNIRLSDKIYQDIKDDIVSGELKENTFLAEGEIATKFGVSKAPVKAALQSLSQEGFLICFPRRGYMVATISVDEYEYVKELRLHLEKLCIKLIIERASDEEILSLRDVLKNDGSKNLPYKTDNTNFHIRLSEITKNPFISEILQKYLALTARYAIRIKETNEYHHKIIDALLERNVEKATQYLEEDMNEIVDK